jgi:hypothetical protein
MVDPFTFHRHVSSHLIHKILTNAQTQACPLDVDACVLLELGEVLEELRKVFC